MINIPQTQISSQKKITKTLINNKKNIKKQHQTIKIKKPPKIHQKPKK